VVPAARGPRVVVLGGSDAAMDAMRAALRLGAASVTCLFEGTAEELHGRREEHEHAREEGVTFRYRVRAVAFEGDARGRVTGVRCRRLGWDEAERRGPQRAFGMGEGEFVVPADLVIVALGYVPDPLLTDPRTGLQTGPDGRLLVDPQTGHTSRPGVFAGGDGVHGPDLVVTAIAAGRRTAAAIDAYLRSLDDGHAAVNAPQLAPPGRQPRRRGRRWWFGR
jgi:glutamate synthase (NADPH/NADH) small chain